ncbi:hypothetical protein U729_3082 (plasmid) [Clostridium baratii str. Sullivan]|uniref:Uncharacterized protein n=1 Tax=Clostridium baratii str. Sullivan TaxID=1415775 RepID=A0A0A7G2T4_9CLOT|nr:hypothetical protein [Clostridium baratii]AIY85291.1 hypothetical protein U729_3082 [Clostridium baratii str. Sullivan]
MIERVYNGESYIDAISQGTDTIKYNIKKELGDHLKLLTHSGLYNLDYNLNMIDCEFNKGLEYEVEEVCYSTDNYVYVLSGERTVRKLSKDLEEIAVYRSDKQVNRITIDDKNNVYVYGGNYLIKLNNNLELIKSTYYERINNLIYAGNNKLFLTVSSGMCYIIDADTLQYSKSYSFFEIVRNAYIDSEGNYYVNSDDKVAKLDKDFTLIKKVTVESTSLYIKDANTFYAIKTGGNFKISKLNENLEVVASYDSPIRGDLYKVKDGYFMFCDMGGITKLNENLELINKLERYVSQCDIDENLNVYIYGSGVICKYNDNLEKVKEIAINDYPDILYCLNNKLYVPSSDGVKIYNENLELVKEIDYILSVRNIFSNLGEVYTVTSNYNLYKINEGLDDIKSLVKLGERYIGLLYDGRVYTLNYDNKIRRFNNNAEEVSSLDLKPRRIDYFVITDNIYVQTDYTKISKVDKGLSKINIYTAKSDIDKLHCMKGTNNILIQDYDSALTVINSKLEKVAEYKYTGTASPEYYVNDYIYCVDEHSITKLDNSLNIIATYTLENIDDSINRNQVLFLDDGSVFVIFNDTQVINLNSELKEVKRYVSTENVYELYDLKNGNIAISCSKIIKKLSSNLEEIASMENSSVNSILTLNEYHYIITVSGITKVDSNLETIKEISCDSINQVFRFADGIYVKSNYSLIKYDENLEKVNAVNGIYFKDLINVLSAHVKK